MSELAYFSSVQKPNLTDRVLTWAIILIGLGMITFHVLIVWLPIFNSILNQNTHLAFANVLLFLTMARATEVTWRKVLYLMGLPVSVFIAGYLAFHYERLDFWSGMPEPTDVWVGVVLIFFVLMLSWRFIGAVFSVMALTGIAYAIWGHLIPGFLGHPEFEFGYIVSNLSVGFKGIFGFLMSASVNILFLFMIFGATFQVTGVNELFMEIGKFFSRHLTGGAGQTAIFSSSFVGMVNGAAVANVAITGSYTIPLMKKSGFRGETAGAIEAMASTGGQLTPPIMGVAVFLMASFLGVTYAELMMKALVPAILYYTAAALGVVLIASREKIPRSTEEVNTAVIKKNWAVFVIPMAILTVMLVLRYSPGYSALFGLIAIIALSYLQKETRPKFKVLIDTLVNGAVIGAVFAVAVGAIGIFVKVLIMTAAISKLPMLVSIISGDSLVITLILTMILSIMLGAALPTVVAYVVVALTVAPILIEMGLSKEIAHFYVYYFAIMAAITPPVAGAAIVASQIAGASFMKTGWESLKLAMPFFLLPYFLAKHPFLFLYPEPLADVLSGLSALLIAMGGMLFFCQGYSFRKLNEIERYGFLVASLTATAYGLYEIPVTLILAALLFVGLTGFQWVSRTGGSPATS